MAARRLIVVMLALLVGSTFVAALVPQRESDNATDEVSPPPATANEAAAPPLEVRVGAGAETERRRTIIVAPGRRVSLDVASPQVDLVAIPALGLLEDVAPLSPAHFDLLIDRPGSYAVRLVEAGRTIATIEVRPDQGDGSGRSKDSPGSNSAGSTPGASSAS